MRRIGIVTVLVALAFLSVAAWAGTPPAASSWGTMTLQQRKQVLESRHGVRNTAHPASMASSLGHPAPGSWTHVWKKSSKNAMVQAAALSLVVTSTNDSGPGSLRDAIDQANANPGSTITFSLAYPTTITLTSGQLDIESNMTITGPGAGKLTIDGDGENRIFEIGEAIVSISGLTIANGYSSYDEEADWSGGGGIENWGILTLTNSQVVDCYTEGYGGGILNLYQLTVNNCSVTNNESENYAGGIEDASYLGGESAPVGVSQEELYSMVLVNTSLLNNNAWSDGGAMSLDGYVVSMTNVTISDNSSGGCGGGCWGDSYEAELLNTVVAYNEAEGGQDWCGGFYSYGHNLIDYTDDIDYIDGPATGDIYNVEAMLSYPPALNGGPTLNEIAGPGSPLIDAGDDSVLGPPLSLVYDQRGPGFPRKIGSHVDIGATESEVFMSLFDDYANSMVCVGTTTGTFGWIVIGGPYEGATYFGTLNVYNGGTMFWSQPGAPQYVYIYYDPNNHTAWGYLYDYTTGLYSSLYDSNTLDDPPVCEFFQGGGDN